MTPFFSMQKAVEIKKMIVAETVGLSFMALFSLMLNLLFRNLCVYFCASIYDTNGIFFFSFCISAAEYKKLCKFLRNNMRDFTVF